MADKVFSVTEIINYKRCRRRWDFESLGRRSLTSKVTAAPLELGTIVHKALEAWGKQPAKRLVVLAEMAAMAEIARIKKAVPNIEELNPYFISDQAEIVDMVKAIGENYEKKYGQPLPSQFELVALEQEIRIPLVTQPDGSVLWLEGTLDKLVRHRRSGNLFILDHKTFGSHPTEYSIMTDEQFLLYIMIGRYLEIGPVVGVFYDGMWKRKEPPRGRTFDDLFFRMEVIRSEHEINEAYNFAKAIVTEMADPNTVMYTNRRWGGCTDCSGMRRLCDAVSNGEDVEFILDEFYIKRISTKDKRLD